MAMSLCDEKDLLDITDHCRVALALKKVYNLAEARGVCNGGVYLLFVGNLNFRLFFLWLLTL
jgi:hypothetical protein